jgi:hypothetical protein
VAGAGAFPNVPIATVTGLWRIETKVAGAFPR